MRNEVSTLTTEENDSRFRLSFPWDLAAIFVLIRFILFVTIPYEGIQGYGDFLHFFNMARLGAPFIDFWVEFPPLFPFLSEILEMFASGRAHTYGYLLILLLTVVQAGNLVLVSTFASKMYTQAKARKIGLVYLALIVGLPYGWWYFDVVVVFWMLLGLKYIFEESGIKAGFAIGLGMLTKWFPVLLIAEVWRRRSVKFAIVTTITALLLVVLVLGMLMLTSPDMTEASLRSQLSKGSWETVWALIDGNYSTGNFGPEIERYDPALATISRRAPAVVPPLVTFLLFGGIGIYLMYRVRGKEMITGVAFIGATWSLFLLWSPGWSPQWILYLLPLVLLAIPFQRAVMISLSLVLISVLEWPILLSRGMFDLMWVPVMLRTFIIILIFVEMARIAISSSDGVPPEAMP